MSRMWIEKMKDNPTPKPMTDKDKFLTVLGIVVDATIIGLLILTLVVNSCQICYQTGAGYNTYQKCKNVADVMETGMPSEVITHIYNQEEQSTTGQKIISIMEDDVGGVIEKGSANISQLG